MKNRPSFISFLVRNMLGCHKYYYYHNTKTGKIYKEINALKTRFIAEIIIAFVPIVTFILFIIMNTYFTWNDIILYIASSIILFLIFIANPMRFWFVNFIEISNIKEAYDTRINFYEIALLVFGTVGLILLMIYIGRVLPVN